MRDSHVLIFKYEIVYGFLRVFHTVHLCVGRILFKGSTNNEMYSRMAVDGRCVIQQESSYTV